MKKVTRKWIVNFANTCDEWQVMDITNYPQRPEWMDKYESTHYAMGTYGKIAQMWTIRDDLPREQRNNMPTWLVCLAYNPVLM